jgi:hypothetical protein
MRSLHAVQQVGRHVHGRVGLILNGNSLLALGIYIVMPLHLAIMLLKGCCIAAVSSTHPAAGCLLACMHASECMQMCASTDLLAGY